MDVAQRAAQLMGPAGAHTIVFGSVARGTADDASDVDLLVVHDSEIETETVLDALGDLEFSVAAATFTFDELSAPDPRTWVFLSLVFDEGRVLHDPDGRLTSALKAMPRPTSAQLAEAAAALRTMLSVRLAPRPADPFDTDGPQTWLPALAAVFRWTKAACYYAARARGQYSAGRLELLHDFAAQHPGHADDVAAVIAAYPFYARQMGRDLLLPFDPQGDCHREVARAADAGLRIIDTICAELVALV